MPTEPEADRRRARQPRAQRPCSQGDGRLFIVAADHPARGALGVRGDALAMADRYDLLRRLVVALERPGVDGVLGTPDILEDLALLGALDGKVVVGSMNRGGLQGATFEMDDRFTAYSAAAIVDSGFDFAKLLVRINLEDAGTAADARGHGARGHRGGGAPAPDHARAVRLELGRRRDRQRPRRPRP